MPKIAIIGASSQVAGEVACYLALESDVELIGLVRSEYSSALLRMNGIPHAVVDYADRQMLCRILASCDTVVDFVYPSGQPTAILPRLMNHLEAVIPAMRAGSRYITMSSIMAHGMPGGSEEAAHYRIARTSYAYVKRRAEARAYSLGAQGQVTVYALRLGQVHGLLQTVSGDLIATLASGVLSSNGTPGSLTNTVFASSVAKAILECGAGNVRPHTYTLVSQPQWTLGELYRYYQERYEIEARIRYAGIRSRSTPRGGALRRCVWPLAMANRELLETYLLHRSPALFRRAKGVFRSTSLAREVVSLAECGPDRVQHMLGPTPGRVLSVAACSPVEVMAAERRLERLMESRIQEHLR